MSFTIATGCFINGSGYAQILGDDFNDNSLASPWLNLNSAINETNNRLEIRAQNNNINTPANIEGGIFGVSVIPTVGDYVQWTATYVDTDDTCGSGLSISATEVDFDGTGQLHIFMSPVQLRVYLSGTQKYTQAITGSNDNVFRIQFTASGFDVYVNNMSAPVYQYTTGALTATYYFYACNVSPDNLYDFYIDNLSYSGYGVFSVHDAGQTYIYHALGQDFSTLAVTSSGASSIGLRYRSGVDGINYGAWSGWYTEAEMQALASESDPYIQLEVRFKGGINANIPEIVLEGITDITPPGPPTDAYSVLFATNNYAMLWTEPTDSDFSHCELKRVIESTTTYLGKDGSNLPAWEASPGTYWKFADDDTTKDSIQSNYVDEAVTGSPTYYVCSVDVYDNKSEWVKMSLSSSAADYPIEANVKKDVTYNFGTYTGTLESTDPGATNVKSGTTYYIESVEYTGRYVPDYPAETNVKLGIVFGNSVYTGTLESTDPGIANVELGIAYKINSVDKIGTRKDADPGIANVRFGTTYYIDSVLLTGTLTAGLPAQGTLTATDNGNETVTLTITGTDAANTTNVYVRNTVHGAWESTALATITGNDSDTQALSAGDYELKIVTENASGNQIGGATDPVFLHVNNPGKSIQYFNVLKVLGNPGDGKKRLLLEARTQPINPQTPTV